MNKIDKIIMALENKTKSHSMYGKMGDKLVRLWSSEIKGILIKSGVKDE